MDNSLRPSRTWSGLAIDYASGLASERTTHKLALNGIIRRLIPKSAVLAAHTTKLIDLVACARPERARFGPENAGLDDRRHLAEVLAVADVIIRRAAVGGESQPVAVLGA